MKTSTQIEAGGTATNLLRQPTSPPQDSMDTAGSRKPSKSQQAPEHNTHNVWDNLGCLVPQPIKEVSGFRSVDWLDKDT